MLLDSGGNTKLGTDGATVVWYGECPSYKKRVVEWQVNALHGIPDRTI